MAESNDHSSKSSYFISDCHLLQVRVGVFNESTRAEECITTNDRMMDWKAFRSNQI